MGLRFDTNVPALNASRSLNRSEERLSSDLRIHRAADDAAGLDLNETTTILQRIRALAVQTSNDTQDTHNHTEIDAYQHRIEFTVNTLAIQQENSTAAESAIRDAGIAAATIAFTRNEILVSTGSSMWAQANVIPQTALTLLGSSER